MPQLESCVMGPGDSREAVGCLSPEQLLAFAVGKLPMELLDKVAAHLGGCSRCVCVLENLHDRGDALIASLRNCDREEALLPPALSAGTPSSERVAPPDHDKLPTTVDEEPPATPSGEMPLPRWFGRYVLVEQLGCGAMGKVYKARQPGTNRLVALKMIRAGSYAEPHELARFRVEIEAAARVNHVNVVTVYECGEHDGLPYFCQELVEGGTLAERLGGKPLPEREAAALVRSLAHGLQHIHNASLVHRDLKPRNILLTDDGTPKISDFGLAKLRDRDGCTETDAILGTPAYMAPEQAAGHSKHSGPAADIYALGAILYEALTGRPPFRGESKAAILEQVRTRKPPRPRAIRPGLDPALERIVLRCLHREPGLRYGSASEVADALDRWLVGRRPPVQPWYWLSWVWYTARLQAAWIGMALLVVGGAAVVLALWALDPDRPLREIKAQLARGEPVTLIGPTGSPRWSRWRLGEAQVGVNAEGVFTVSTWADASLLELVDNPQASHFLFRAEVRHEQSDKVYDGVGLYVGYRAPSGDDVPVHGGCRLTYDDMFDAVEAWRRLPAKAASGPQPKGNLVYLGGFMHVEQEGGLSRRCAFANVAPEAFRAAGPRHPQWRKLAVEVSPALLAGRWAGDPLGQVPAEKFRREGDFFLGQMRRTGWIGPSSKIDTSLHPLGGLGLFLSHGSASFRNVVVEPLGNDP
jgi:serine/threonine-protein kinase